MEAKGMSRFYIYTVAMAALLVGGNTALANDVYISQTGGGNGSSCSSPMTASYFDTASNWTAGNPSGTLIGPGTTVHLCGTFTAPAGSSGYLTFQGGGTSGRPITVVFEPGAILQAPYWGGSGAISASGLNYITVNLGSNGVIQTTANGSAFANKQANPLVGFSGVSNLLIECATSSSSCMVGPNYVNVGPIAISSISGDGSSATVTCVSSCKFAVGSRVAINGTSNSAFNTNTILTVSSASGNTMSVNSTVAGSSSGGFVYDEATGGPAGLVVNDGKNVTIQNLNVQWAHWCIMYTYHGGNTDQNVLIQNNTIKNCDHGISLAAGNANAALSNIAVHDNDISDGYLWDDSRLVNYNHHDGVHAWHQPGSSLTGLMLYNNYVHGNWGAGLNSFLFMQDSGSNNYVFNNIINDQDTLGHAGCEYICVATGTETGLFLANNTLIGTQTAINFDGSGISGAQIYNNIFLGLQENIRIQAGASITAMDYNDSYACIASYGKCWNFNTFSTWGGMGYDLHSVLANPKLTTSYVPQSRGVVNIGKNFYTMCNGQPNPGLGALCYDKVGKPRPATGKWDVGALSFGAPVPPTGLMATPH
jgi:hypothetical protein